MNDAATAQHFVAVLMGSDSDWKVMAKTVELLREYEIAHEVRITSAHRTPDETRDYVRDAEERGCAVFIAAAGMAAHLAGAVAAQSCRPVIGVPIEASLNGLDSLLSTVQMPSGVPVATVAIGSAGAANAAHLAAQILGIADPRVAQTARERRARSGEAVSQKNSALQKQLKQSG